MVVSLPAGVARAGERPSAPTLRWRQFHFDPALSGFNRFERELGASNVGSLGLQWTQTGDSTPAAADGVIYVGGEDLRAIDAVTGQELWSQPIHGYFDSSDVATYQNLVFVASDDFYSGNALFAYEASTGVEVWHQRIEGAYRITVAGGRLFVQGDFGTVYVFDARTGAGLWHATRRYASSAIAVVGGLAYFTTYSSTPSVIALDADTGDLVWTWVAPAEVMGGLAVGPEAVYVTIYARPAIYALDRATGLPLWSQDVGSTSRTLPTVARGRLYVGTDEGDEVALDAHDGSILWTTNVTWMVFSDSSLANGVLYLGAGLTLDALDAGTGAVLWSFTPAGEVTFNFQPMVVDGWLYAASFGGDGVYAFHPTS
jgi:outer membrane protein assembly factor BamB